MAHQFEHPDYTVSVEGGFVDRHRWLIHAVVTYPANVDPERRHRALTDARSALVLGVLREARHGEEMGARTVRVRIEGDPVVAGTFVMSRLDPRTDHRARTSGA